MASTRPRFTHLLPAGYQAAACTSADDHAVVATADFILACGARAGTAVLAVGNDAERRQPTASASARILAAAKLIGLAA